MDEFGRRCAVPGPHRTSEVTNRLAKLLALWVAAFTLGCYRYVPVDLDAVPVGTRVRALLTTEGRIGVRMRAGLVVESLKGTLIQKDADTLLFAVQWVGPWSDYGGRATVVRHVKVPRGDVVHVDRRELDKTKTYSLVGGVVAAGAVGSYLVFRPREPGGGPLLPPVQPEERVQVVLLSAPLPPVPR